MKDINLIDDSNGYHKNKLTEYIRLLYKNEKNLIFSKNPLLLISKSYQENYNPNIIKRNKRNQSHITSSKFSSKLKREFDFPINLQKNSKISQELILENYKKLIKDLDIKENKFVIKKDFLRNSFDISKKKNIIIYNKDNNHYNLSNKIKPIHAIQYLESMTDKNKINIFNENKITLASKQDLESTLIAKNKQTKSVLVDYDESNLNYSKGPDKQLRSELKSKLTLFNNDISKENIKQEPSKEFLHNKTSNFSIHDNISQLLNNIKMQNINENHDISNILSTQDCAFESFGPSVNRREEINKIIQSYVSIENPPKNLVLNELKYNCFNSKNKLKSHHSINKTNLNLLGISNSGKVSKRKYKSKLDTVLPLNLLSNEQIEQLSWIQEKSKENFKKFSSFQHENILTKRKISNIKDNSQMHNKEWNHSYNHSKFNILKNFLPLSHLKANAQSNHKSKKLIEKLVKGRKNFSVIATNWLNVIQSYSNPKSTKNSKLNGIGGNLFTDPVLDSDTLQQILNNN